MSMEVIALFLCLTLCSYSLDEIFLSWISTKVKEEWLRGEVHLHNNGISNNREKTTLPMRNITSLRNTLV